MQLETQALGVLLVHIVVQPIGLQFPLAPWVLSLATPLGGLCCIRNLAEHEPASKPISLIPSLFLAQDSCLSSFNDGL